MVSPFRIINGSFVMKTFVLILENRNVTVNNLTVVGFTIFPFTFVVAVCDEIRSNFYEFLQYF